MGRSRCGWLLLVSLMASSIVAQDTLLVHLPSAPAEAANRQAEAVNALAEVLSARLPDRTIEAKIYRRWRDASQVLSGNPENVNLLLTDASFVVDASTGHRPAYRFVHAGSGTYRRLLVVRSDRGELNRLVDLRDKSLAVVEAAGFGDGAGDAGFLRDQVFEDELDPLTWFATLKPSSDDFSATASVLYGQSDAALVAEYNPLLASHLGKDLRTVFESPELSLPVLWIRESAFTPEARQLLAETLRTLGDDPTGRTLLADLGIDGFAPVDGGYPLATATARPSKTLAIAVPAGDELDLVMPSLPAASELTFAVAVELPEIPLPVDGQGGSR